MSQADPSPARAGLSDPKHRLWLLAAVPIFLVTLHFPFWMPEIALDSSWQQVLSWAVGRDVVFGRDFVFNYGPLGFLRSFTYEQDLYALRCAFEIVQALGFAALFTWHLRRMSAAWEALAYLFVVCIALPTTMDGAAFAAMLALSFWGMRRESHLAAFLVPPLLWFFGLQKFSFMVLAAICIGGMSLALLAGRRQRDAIALGAGTCTLPLLWWAIGQPLDGLPEWILGSIEITRGYSVAMGFPGSAAELALSLCFVAVALAFVSATWARPPLRLERLALGGLALGWVFLVWKAGFSRQDDPHVPGAIAALALLPFLVRSHDEIRLARPLAVGAMTLGLIVAAAVGAPHFAGVARMARPDAVVLAFQRARANTQILFGALPDSVLQGKLARNRRRYALPRVRDAVEAGRGRVDFYGQATGWIFLNELPYALRPTIQNYNAYTEALQRLDAEWYRGPHAPEWSLVDIEAIDGRWPTGDAALAFDVLRHEFEPALHEQDLLLLKRRSATARAVPQRTLVLEREIAWGEVLVIPDPGDTLHLSVDVQPTWWGRVRSLVWRSPRVYLEVRIDQAWTRFQLIASQSSHAFLLNPALIHTEDLLKWAQGIPIRRVQAIRMVLDDSAFGAVGAFRPHLGVRLERGSPEAFPGVSIPSAKPVASAPSDP